MCIYVYVSVCMLGKTQPASVSRRDRRWLGGEQVNEKMWGEKEKK